MPFSHLILCRLLLLLPSIPPSIRVFSNESTLRMRWPKYWSFSFSIVPSKVHPGLISFRMDSVSTLILLVGHWAGLSRMILLLPVTLTEVTQWYSVVASGLVCRVQDNLTGCLKHSSGMAGSLGLTAGPTQDFSSMISGHQNSEIAHQHSQKVCPITLWLQNSSQFNSEAYIKLLLT